MRVPVLSDFGQEDLIPGPGNLNLTILSPSYGGDANASGPPWWTFGTGLKRLPVTVRVVNNTSYHQISLSFSLVAGAVSIVSPTMGPTVESLSPGSAKDYTVDVELAEGTRGVTPAILTAVVNAFDTPSGGMATTSAVSNITLNVPG